ncbi:hypothetical protein JKP88DRAFT_261576, partial [Tribonema minus]
MGARAPPMRESADTVSSTPASLSLPPERERERKSIHRAAQSASLVSGPSSADAHVATAAAPFRIERACAAAGERMFFTEGVCGIACVCCCIAFASASLADVMDAAAGCVVVWARDRTSGNAQHQQLLLLAFFQFLCNLLERVAWSQCGHSTQFAAVNDSTCFCWEPCHRSTAGRQVLCSTCVNMVICSG